MPHPPTVETPQLVLRASTPEDAEALFEIQGDAEAMQHTYCAPDVAATARYLARYADRCAIDGFGPWTAWLKEPRRIVAWGGLGRDPVAPEWGPEVAYFVHRAFWGRGLATEIVEAALAFGFGPLGLPEIVAFTRPENRASRRVLEKAGFAWARHVPELERDQYLLAADDWRGRAP